MRSFLVAVLVAISAVSAADSLSEEEKGEAAYRQANTLTMILSLYFLDHGSYPSEEQGVAVLASSSASPKGAYLKSDPIDPWGRRYAYSATLPCPYVFSLGADGRIGGDGYDADIYPYGKPCGTPNK